MIQEAMQLPQRTQDMFNKYKSFIHFQVDNHNVMILPSIALDIEPDILPLCATEEDIEEVVA